MRLKLRVESDDDVPEQSWTVRVEHSYRERLSFEWTDSVYLPRLCSVPSVSRQPPAAGS